VVSGACYLTVKGGAENPGRIKKRVWGSARKKRFERRKQKSKKELQKKRSPEGRKGGNRQEVRKQDIKSTQT